MKSKKEFIPDLIKESETLINSNRIIEAREILVNVLTNYDDENIDAANNYAVTEILLGNYQAAEDLLIQVLQQDPQNSIASDNLSYLKKQKYQKKFIHDKEAVLRKNNYTTGVNKPQNSLNKSGNGSETEFVNDFYENLYYSNKSQVDNLKESEIDAKLSLSNLKRISFEISNVCNLAGIHKLCPINQHKEKNFLSSEIVEKTIDELAFVDYKGIISFHIYNEPLMDPRLIWFIRYAKTKCPNSTVYILTNGQNLNQELVDELQKAGVGLLVVSAYSVNEFNRVKHLKAKIPFKVFKAILDARMDMYEKTPMDLAKTCIPFLRDLSVNCFGDVVICCLDWRRKHIFGNLCKESLNEIFNKHEVIQVHSDLLNGERNLHLCRRCDWTR